MDGDVIENDEDEDEEGGGGCSVDWLGERSWISMVTNPVGKWQFRSL